MKRSKFTQALSLLLALALTLPLAVLPANAGQFRDVVDSQTSMAADVLSALGIVNGTGDGQFSPDGRLTRAQLCKIAVLVLGMGDKVEAQSYRTIFTDMGSKHWARGYVNLAATTEVPEGSGARLMLGLGNGTFGPDRDITYQEAVTLALRILGYGEEANKSWPSGAIQTANRLGLDQDLNIQKPTDPITRGQTALLFYRLLSTPSKGGTQPFAANLGTLEDNVIILSTNATVNNQSGWVIAAQDGASRTYRPAAPLDSSLLGLRGSALLDGEGRFVTLLPDQSSYVFAAVTQKQGYYLYLAGRGRYTLAEDTPVYNGSAYDSSVSTYKDYAASLQVGDVVTLYLDSAGRVTGLFRSEASPEAGFLVVRSTPVNPYSLLPLTGGASNYTVRKNGATISLADIKQYDVVTYDPISRVLDVCDVRLNCVYENAYPSPEAPSTITAAGGNSFTVLANAMGDFSGRRLGDSITLLFTSNGMVAGVLSQYGWGWGGYNASSNALGVLVGNEFQLLGCRKTLQLNEASMAQLQGYTSGLLSAYSSQRGILSLQSAGTYISAQFYPSSLTLGSMRVSPGVRIYERLAGGAMRARNLTDLPASVTATQYHVDSSGLVDLIIIGSYSGDGVEYGRIDVLNGYRVEQIDPGYIPNPDDPDEQGQFRYPTYERKAAQQVSFDGGEPVSVADGRTLYSGYAQLAISSDGEVVYANYLRAIPDVPSSAFYIQDGITYVNTSQGVLQVDDGVQCYNIAASYSPSSFAPAWVNNSMWSDNLWQGDWPDNWTMEWFPTAPIIVKFSDLAECRNFASTLTLYVDSVGQRVRVIEAR